MKFKIARVILLTGNLFLFVVDRLSKILASQRLPIQGVFVFDGFGLVLEKNQGLAFGLPFPPSLIIILMIIVLLVLFYCWSKFYLQKNILILWSLSLVIIGAFSNLLDRSSCGYVIDFIRVPYWSNFNLADVYIVCGLFLLIIELYRKEKTKTFTPH